MRRYIFIFIFLFSVNLVLSLEGVSPGSYDVLFEPGLERELVFDFSLDGVGELKVEGELAKYVELDKERALGREKVFVKLKLPEKIDEPGVNNIWIVAGNVKGLIRVRVPYPNKFIDLELGAPNVNEGEDIFVSLKVFNFGEESLVVAPVIEIYSGEEVVEVFNLDESYLGASNSLEFSRTLDGKKYLKGDYLAVAELDYGERVARDENIFRVGEFNLRILNYTKEVVEGVGKFGVEVESLWNSRMREVFAEVRVIGRQNEEGEVLLDRTKGFDTTIVSLGPFEKKNLVGFFDSEGLEGEVMISVDVHYDGEVESEVFRIKVVPRFIWWPWCVGGALLLLLIFLITWFFRKKSA